MMDRKPPVLGRMGWKPLVLGRMGWKPPVLGRIKSGNVYGQED